MDSTVATLRKNAARIARNVAVACDEDGAEPFLVNLVHRLATCAASRQPLETDVWRNLPYSELSRARMLRGLLFESIEHLREETESSREHALAQGRPFAEAVLELRKVVHVAIPRPETSAEDREFFRHLLARDCEGYAADHCRLFRLFEDLAQTSPDILYVHDLNGMLLYVNLPGLDLLKFSPEDIVNGLSLFDLVTPNLADLVEARLEAAGAGACAPYTGELMSKDGERIPVEIATRPIVRGERIAGIVAVARDLRLARRLESALRQSNLLFDGVLAHVPVAVFQTDRRCGVIEANATAASILGVPEKEALLGRPLYALFDEGSPDLRGVLSDTLRSGGETHCHLMRNSLFGAPMNCDMTAMSIGGPTDPEQSLLVFLNDVSDREALQQSLARSERLSVLGEIVAGVAHELNNPLTGILGYAQLLMSANVAPDVKSRLDRIMSEAERCRKIVENLLTFARYSSSAKSLQNVNDLVRNTLALREYQLSIDGVETEQNLDRDVPAVLMDAREMQRVFLCIVTNAHQAMAHPAPPGVQPADARTRKLKVTTFFKNRRVHIAFADTGPGIPRHLQPRVFDPFFTTKDVGEGTGLGLSVAYGVVTEHGGQILLDSEEGRGATFTVVLPCATDR